MNVLVTNIYSEYSLLQSTNRMDALVARAAELGYEAIALTDPFVMYGTVPFYKACLSHGMKPLIGLEVRIVREEESFPARVIAKNQAGYRRLIQLATKMGFSKEPQLSIGDLQKATADCAITLPEEALGAGSEHEKKKRFFELAGDGDAYLELPGRKEDARLAAFAQRTEIPLIAASPVRFLVEEEAEAYKMIRAIAAGESTANIRLPEEWRTWFLPSTQTFEERFAEYPEALANATALASCSKVSLELGNARIPAFDGLDGEQATKELRERCEKGIQQRFGSTTEQIVERIRHELTVIAKMGYASYFLIVADFMDFARRNNILTGPGRGSSAGSLVAYVLYITDVDPLSYNLLFERFLNPERASLPDIDIDFPDYRRDEVINYVRRRYGEDRVAQIVTFGTFAARAAVRDAGKALGYPQTFVDKVAKAVPQTAGVKLREAREKGRFASIREERELADLLARAEQIEGLPRHASTHAAGVIISDQPLTNVVALERGQESQTMVQAEMGSLEELGLLKFDLLGLRNLTLLERIFAHIQASTGEVLQATAIPMEDMKTFEMLRLGKTSGVFQLESAGMRDVLSRLEPSRFEDIVAASALYRPGPMDFIPDYVAKKHGKEQVHYVHPDIEPILGPTYGVIVYQEQIMQLAQVMAGYTLAEADILRRAISKKKQELMSEQRQQFVARSLEKGYASEVATEVFDLIARFASYGFPRSHAVAYSMISYWLAYLKVHYPKAFYAALFSSVWQHQEKLSTYIAEAKKEGIVMLKPSMERSSALFTLETKGIRTGLLPIVNVGLQTVRELMNERQRSSYKDLFDVCSRLPTRVIPKRTLEGLIKAGAMDEFHVSRSVLLHSLDKAIDFATKVRRFQESAGELFTIERTTPNYVEADPSTRIEELEYEREALGFYLTGHPVEEQAKTLKKYGRAPIAEAMQTNGEVRVAGLVQSVRKITTKKGDPMGFLMISDESGQCEVVVFPRLWKQTEALYKEQHLLFLEGSFEERNEQKQLLVNKVVSMEQILTREKPLETLYLRVTEQEDTPTRLSDIKYVLNRSPGHTPVVLFREKEESSRLLQNEFSVTTDRKTVSILKHLLGEENVVIRPRGKTRDEEA
ncbi:DNA polymerase III subunit alpha [Shouchella shacheensis]|uniref:DNA polymerase III subunit alpha n=1 Tax=Shouchella shacheensis TaxID=1649580 RepID=UPI0007405272|nr:DNA polymerase III subunit alpha [Shouchella shacheensis]